MTEVELPFVWFLNIERIDGVLVTEVSVCKDILLELAGNLDVSVVTVAMRKVVVYVAVQLIWSMLHKSSEQHK